MVAVADPIERWQDALHGIETPPADATGEDVPCDAYAQFPEAKIEPSPSTKEATTCGMKQAIKLAFTAIQDRAARGCVLAGESIGYPLLDRALDGLQRGKLYVVGARSGLGKSIFALNAALNLAKGGSRVVYFTLEMPTQEQVVRALFCWAGISVNRLKNGTLRKDDWTALNVAAQQLCGFPFVWDEACGLTIEHIESRLIEHIEATTSDEQPPFAVVIDHVLLVRGTNDRQPRREQLNHITEKLKTIAKERNVAVIALNQLNRQLEARTVKDKHPQISDLKESGSFEQDADAIMLLYRKDHYREEGESADNTIEVIVPKVRGGEQAMVKLSFRGDCYRIDNLEREEPNNPPHPSEVDQ